MKQKVISLVKKYGITFALMGLFTWSILASRGYSSDMSQADKLFHLGDAFFVPGIVVVLFGALVWVSTTGFFDALSYGAMFAIHALLPFTRRGDNEKYYDYKVRKDEKRAKGYGFIFICGAIYLLVGIILSSISLNVN